MYTFGRCKITFNLESFVCYAGLILAFSGHFAWICTGSSVSLHNNMFAKVMRVPMRFYAVNPVGRVLNRFSKDLGTVDELLPQYMLDVITVSNKS